MLPTKTHQTAAMHELCCLAPSTFVAVTLIQKRAFCSSSYPPECIFLQPVSLLGFMPFSRLLQLHMLIKAFCFKETGIILNLYSLL